MRCPLLIAAALAVALAAATASATTSPGTNPPSPYRATLHVTRTIGPRPAASAAEIRTHRYAIARFRAAGLRTAFERFTVPRHGRSRDAIGILQTPASCLTILMAHADT